MQGCEGILPRTVRPRCGRWSSLRRYSSRCAAGTLTGSAQHLAPAVGVDADGHDDGHRDNVVIAADFDVGGVQPEIGPVALDRPGQEGIHTLVDLAAQAGV